MFVTVFVFLPSTVAAAVISPDVFVTFTVNDKVSSLSISTFQDIAPFSGFPSFDIVSSTNSVPSGTNIDTFIPSNFLSLLFFNEILYVISSPAITYSVLLFVSAYKILSIFVISAFMSFKSASSPSVSNPTTVFVVSIVSVVVIV